MVAKVKGANQQLTKLHKNYMQRLEWEKYMCPKGLKPTITANFHKPQQEHDFLNIDMKLQRSPKPMDENWLAFRCS